MKNIKEAGISNVPSLLRWTSKVPAQLCIQQASGSTVSLSRLLVVGAGWGWGVGLQLAYREQAGEKEERMPEAPVRHQGKSWFSVLACLRQ